MPRKLSSYLVLILMAALILLGTQATAMADDLELGRALYQAGEQRNLDMKGVMLDCLGHPNAHIRRIAAHALGKLGCTEACPGLMRLADDPGQPLMVRCVAVRSLGRIGSPQARGTLQGLCCDGNRVLRSAANQSLRLLVTQGAS